MQEQNQKEDKIDYDMQMQSRQRNFISRFAGAVAGGITAVAASLVLLRKSLHNYLYEALNTRDWLNGPAKYEEKKVHPNAAQGNLTSKLKEILGKVEKGDAQTLSGAPTVQDAIKEFVEQNHAKLRAGEELDLGGTTVGDIRANAAYRDLVTNNKELVGKCIKDFERRAEELVKFHDSKMETLSHQYFATDSKKCWETVARVQKEFRKTGDIKARQKAIDALEGNPMFKGRVSEFFDEFDQTRENLHRFVNKAKMELVDGPMFDELIKKGTQPGRMGLSIRHAHNKGEIFMFSAGAAVAVGVMAHSLAKKFLARNDHKKEGDTSFQAGVMQQRETAKAATPAQG